MALKVSDEWSGTHGHYEPGDHVGVFAVNDRLLVNRLIKRLGTSKGPLPPANSLLQLQIRKNKEQGLCLIIQQTENLI